jgi:hypothetical protein
MLGAQETIPEDAMAQTPSTMTALGSSAPAFSLPDTNGRRVSLGDFTSAPALLVMYQRRGAAIVAINSNDIVRYPDDSPARMKDEVKLAGYTFPYLFDESQQVAKAYDAACTPDFFLYDRNRKLAYRGQLDDSRPSNGVPVTGKDVRAALDAVLAGKPVSQDQRPSIGCNIKWKPGNEPS